MLNITNIPTPYSKLIDDRTGVLSPEWYRFFLNLYNLAGGGSNPVSIPDILTTPVIMQMQDQSGLLELGPSNEDQLVESIKQLRSAMETVPPPLDPEALVSPHISTPRTTGVIDGSFPVTGYVGETVTSTVQIAAKVVLVTVVWTDITSINLTAGSWQIFGSVSFNGNPGTYNSGACAITTAAGNSTVGLLASETAAFFAARLSDGTSDGTLIVPTQRVSISVATTYYLKGFANHSGANNTWGYGKIFAVRIV